MPRQRAACPEPLDMLPGSSSHMLFLLCVRAPDEWFQMGMETAFVPERWGIDADGRLPPDNYCFTNSKNVIFTGKRNRDPEKSAKIVTGLPRDRPQRKSCLNRNLRNNSLKTGGQHIGWDIQSSQDRGIWYGYEISRLWPSDFLFRNLLPAACSRSCPCRYGAWISRR